VARTSFLRSVTAVLLLGAAPLQAQSPPVQVALYGDAVRTYVATGDVATAIAALKGWAEPQFARAIEAYLVLGGKNGLAPAAVLQLEIALAIVGQDPVAAYNCLELAHKLVQRLNTSGSSSPADDLDRLKFAANWYAAAASILLYVNDPARATPFVTSGLELSPESPELRLLGALLTEVRAISAGGVHVPGSLSVRVGGERLRLLFQAQASYDRLVKDHPGFVRARIRLGRVLWMLEDMKGAELHLVRAHADARDPVQRYLSAMFLGALYEHRRDVASARAMYEEALAASPKSQSAAVALGYLDVMAGRPDRAQARAGSVLSRAPMADEWWSYKNGGIDWDAVNWLRQTVRAQ
jgi:tetratricopeptide (TPR) repeat protein